jgi:hypothetical protein
MENSQGLRRHRDKPEVTVKSRRSRDYQDQSEAVMKRRRSGHFKDLAGIQGKTGGGQTEAQGPK